MTIKLVPKNGMYLTREDFPSWGQDVLFDKSNSDELQVMDISFVVTERCNLRCTYCYESHDYHENGKVMTKDVAKKAIDFLLEGNKLNGYFNPVEKPAIILEFIGGEALLEIDLIDYITDYFNKRALELKHPWAFNYAVNIGTNGVLYNTPKVQKYLKKNGSNIHMGITLDGNRQLHDACRVFPDGQGSYDLAEKAILMEKDRMYPMQTKLTIAPENINYLYDAFINCWDLGIDMINANCVFENVWDNTIHPIILYNQLKKIADYLLDNRLFDRKCSSIFVEDYSISDLNTNYCGGNGKMLAIGPDGTCYPCLRFMGHSMQSKREPFICGNIYDGLLNPKCDKKLCDLCSVTIKSQSPDKCLNCKISGSCAVCTAFCYDYYGTPNKRTTFICNMHKAQYLASSYYFNRLYRLLNLDKRFNIDLEEDFILEIINKDEYLLLKRLENGVI